MKSKLILMFASILFFTSCASNKTSNEIVKIEVSREACHGFCPIYQYELSPNERSYFHAEAFNFSKVRPEENKTEGEFQADLSKETWNQLVSYLNKVEFKNDSLKFESPATDLPTMNVAITFADGQKKYISDYGMNGTDTLVEFYDFMDDLKNQVDWKVNQ